jgi:hypothetical protein
MTPKEAMPKAEAGAEGAIEVQLRPYRTTLFCLCRTGRQRPSNALS